ncbi:ribosomal biogenesis protein Gar2 [Talaromyces stipitatus ATCC 10500]|uniref:Ribosomal biogenesis protein Gar2 n=1 Tax=Talaromyces stipitatus (strain ATCC 10500 / CBS 375.48 / QM 6759 / NRRL 1006) TaxID=441959 RepID=B8LUE1_TALSN|nr:rRNA processing protein gar2 [Talaromyces stipitatus ATCC 10500]EED23714.1 ribosomal biogenesis protein Gar2 [Talaromyces stipitatus ATCC 10500]
MASEKKDKKRKATSAAAVAVPDLPNKKSKKASVAESTPASTPKSILKKKNTEEKTNGVSKSTVPETTDEPSRKIKPRKRASDFLSDDEDDEDKSEEEETKSKNKKKQAVQKVEKKETKKAAPSKTKKVEPVAEEESSETSEGSNDDQSENDEIDDQTAELIKGFESSGDEDASEDEGFEAGKPVPRIPDSKKAKRKIQKKLKENDQPDEPGAVYIGRIPHGFYEHQMRAYFSQFGDITRLRLSRNRVTGRSKHYAFIEFASSVVAKIVAETMNNYLMYGHILKCKYVPQEQQHPELWKGANRRYKRVPWNRIEKQRLERGKTRDKWAQKIEQEGKRRLAKAEKLKKLGYEFEMPELKAIDVVPVQEKLSAPEAATGTAAVDAVATVDDSAEKAVVEETPKKKESKKEKSKEKVKKDKEPETAEVDAAPVKHMETTSTMPETSTKKSKSKKSKKSVGKA